MEIDKAIELLQGLKNNKVNNVHFYFDTKKAGYSIPLKLEMTSICNNSNDGVLHLRSSFSFMEEGAMQKELEEIRFCSAKINRFLRKVKVKKK